MTTTTPLLLSLATSWALFGLIWTIQLVHYPSFRYVADFDAFHAHHTTSITLVVMPLMLLELGSSCWLYWKSDFSYLWLLPLLLVILIWGITFLWAIPIHERLGTQRTDADMEALILANWPRTVLWTIKAGWVTWLAYCFWYTRT